MTQDEMDRSEFEKQFSFDEYAGHSLIAVSRAKKIALGAFLSALEYERNRNKWIPVSEGLPEELASVICGWADGTIHLGYLYRGAWFNRATQHFWHHHPTHWQELPAAPKGD